MYASRYRFRFRIRALVRVHAVHRETIERTLERIDSGSLAGRKWDIKFRDWIGTVDRSFIPLFILTPRCIERGFIPLYFRVSMQVTKVRRFRNGSVENVSTSCERVDK